MKQERRRRDSAVALSLSDVRRAFEQQCALSVVDTLGIIHEAQDVLNGERNLVEVQAATVFGAIYRN